MLSRFRAGSVLFAVPLLLALMAGCSAHVGYRTYDPYYHDYHTWNDAEGPYYNQWVVETHHRNVDYGHLPKRDRGDYWRWRHDHPDHR
jgi:hypothetical protein